MRTLQLPFTLQRANKYQKCQLSFSFIIDKKKSNQKNLNCRVNKEANKQLAAVIIFSDWEEFYEKESTDFISQNKLAYCQENYCNNVLSISSSQCNVLITNCHFQEISISGDGGAIYSTSLSKLLVETSAFVNCSASYNGGAIYISKGDCVISGVCGYHCIAYSFSFSDVWQDGGEKEKNFVYDSSIVNCVTYDILTMYHEQGFIDIKSVNLSDNEAIEESALYCAPSVVNNTYGTSVSYSSFANNNANAYCLSLDFWKEKANQYLVKNSNIIKNPKNAITNYQGTTTVINCTIKENKEPAFLGSYGSIILRECSISSDQIISTTWLDTSSIGEKTFINELSFLETESCHVNFDDNSIHSLIPVKKYHLHKMCDDYVFIMLKYLFLICFLPSC